MRASLRCAFLMPVILCMTLYSCKKAEQLAAPESTLISVDGKSMKSKTTTSSYNKSYKSLTTTSNFSADEMLMISIDNVKAGTYDVHNHEVTVIYMENFSTSLIGYNGVYGTVTVTSYTGTNATAKFSVTCQNLNTKAVKVIQGSINVSVKE